MAKKLLFSVTKKDFIIEWYSGSGAGGQHRNKSSNCCRIKHPESGALARGTEQRSREQNKKTAFKRLVSSEIFQTWLRLESARRSVDATEQEKKINAWVDEQLKEEHLKIETFTP